MDYANKLKSSIIFCASSCCHDDDQQQEDESKVLESPPKDILETSKKSLSKLIISELCATIYSMIKIGKSIKNRHRGNSAEFRYDPLSYALNFEDHDSRIDEFPLRDFSARLPPSPKKYNNNNVVVSRDIAAWS